MLTEPVSGEGPQGGQCLREPDVGRAMSSVHLLLVRHGETVWNQENRWQGQADVPLSEAGCEQARRLAQRLRAEGRRVCAIYASDLERALHTAEILGEVLGVAPLSEVGWRERNTGLSEVTTFASGGAVIHSVNDLSHLDGLALSGEVVDA